MVLSEDAAEEVDSAGGVVGAEYITCPGWLWTAADGALVWVVTAAVAIDSFLQ